MIAICVLRRCKKTPIAIKYLSINFLASDAMFQIIGALFSIVKFMDIVKNVTVLKVGYQFTLGLALSVSCASINLLAFDRLIAVTLPLRYQSLVTRFRAVLVILIVWSFNIIACSASFIWFLVDCTVEQSICSGNNGLRASFTDKQHITHIVLFVLYELVNITVYVALALALRNYFDRKGKLTASQNQMNRGNSSVHRWILSLTFLQLVLHLPYLINTFITVVVKEFWYQTWREYVEVLAHALLRVSSIGSLYLYTWKLRECKYVFLTMFCGGNSKFGDTIRALKGDIYKTYKPQSISKQTSATVATAKHSSFDK
ncbi:adenosine receptor A2a-like [Mercenaria mercenaria]|uniref:adenosine receptor A2a-like n=1 Tax=Mercenaria mercenaria TaxID=6596 RepID=UPI001E1DD3F2|nr:adenosine receptor A2a-like [Mercenaria mercenaria]